MKKLSILLCLCSFSVFSQTHYYVDGASGKDANNGTSLATAWKTIQKACNNATPNSIVEIKAGTYYEDDTVNVSGTPGNTITFRNYMNDSVFIDGTGTSGTTILQMTDVSYLNFRNFTVQHLTVNNAQGILVQTSTAGKSTALSFSNIRIKDINWTSNASTVANSNDNAQGFIAYGLDNGMTNLTLDSLQVFNNILGYSEAISLDGNISGFSVTNCIVHDNTNIGIDISGNYGVSGNPSNDHVRNGIVQHNTCYRDLSNYATSGGIYADGSRDVTIEDNTCYENGYGIEVGCEQDGITDSITVKNNLIFNNQENGMSVGGWTETTTGQVLNSVIRNNTFFMNDYANDQSGELYISKASNCIFENNIFYTDSQAVLLFVDTLNPWGNVNFSYNDWYTPFNDSTNVNITWRANSYSTFNSYRTGTSQDGGSQFANPLIVNPLRAAPDLHLTASSPCINKGNPSIVISGGETDFDGNPRISGGRIDEGAYEYVKPAGVNEIENTADGLLIYPNPFKGFTTIVFDNDVPHYLEICDLTGRVINQLSCSGKVYRLSCNGLTPGVYTIKVSDNIHSSSLTSRIVIE